jgi:hypothetical protein
VVEAVQGAAVSVWHLQRVVAKKRDPLSHVCFLDVLAPPGAPLLTQRFWCALQQPGLGCSWGCCACWRLCACAE